MLPIAKLPKGGFGIRSLLHVWHIFKIRLINIERLKATGGLT